MKVPSIGPEAVRSARPTAQRATPGDDQPSSTRGTAGYFKRLWRAELPLSRVFWQDMAVVGTLLNLAAMGLAFIAVALGASTATGIAIFMAPIPYSIFLVVSVWRRADYERGDWAWPARIGAVLWLFLALLI